MVRYYQLIEDDENKPLNTGDFPSPDVVSVAQFNAELVQIIQPIYDDICERGSKVSQRSATVTLKPSQTVRYYKLVENEHFVRYMFKCRQLQKVCLLSRSPIYRIPGEPVGRLS